MGAPPDRTAARRRGGGGARRRARAATVQALYQWHMTGQDAAEIEGQFLAERLAGDDAPAVDRGFFHDLLHGVAGAAEKLDRRLEPLLDRPVAQVDPVERAILRLGAFELVERSEIPTGVTINEAVELAKTFGGENGHRYVNGVLDRLARDVRPGAGRPPPGRPAGPGRDRR